ncbi:hypothetical protein U0070_026238 [Myodes glareolus]|uniref:Uncharacterized protein n=1 Tax=Myodes glareolus TaxID=447135 RepID=A0AAW0J327_MYOGA
MGMGENTALIRSVFSWYLGLHYLKQQKCQMSLRFNFRLRLRGALLGPIYSRQRSDPTEDTAKAAQKKEYVCGRQVQRVFDAKIQFVKQAIYTHFKCYESQIESSVGKDANPEFYEIVRVAAEEYGNSWRLRYSLGYRLYYVNQSRKVPRRSFLEKQKRARSLRCSAVVGESAGAKDWDSVFGDRPSPPCREAAGLRGQKVRSSPGQDLRSRAAVGFR